MIYAPIIIPTLNRVTHLKRCLSSLAANTGAEHTEVFISVDFPPAEKYKKGYEEVKAYLKSADFSRFKEVHIFWQEKNLGPRNNGYMLRNSISDRFDRYIFTEDDNEFSPNFLEYINKGLEIFEKDPKVIGICAAKDTQWIDEGNNVLFAKIFPAYGFGTWFHKENNLIQEYNHVLIPKPLYSFRTMHQLLKRNLCLFNIYVNAILCKNDGLFWNDDGTIYLCDSVRSLDMHFTDKVCVVPSVAKSRTWGNDGSGANMLKTESDPEKDCPIDTETSFEYHMPEEMTFNPENYAIGNRYMSAGQKSSCTTAVISYIILKLNGGNRQRTIRMIEKIRKTLKH